MNLKQCAEHLRVTPWTITQDCKDEKFRGLLRERSEAAFLQLDQHFIEMKAERVERLEEASALALEQMIELCERGSSESIRYKAAQDIMDRDKELGKTKRPEGGSSNMPNFFNSKFLQQVAVVINEESS